MADPIQWKAGEGYDIHVLRGGPASKLLAGALDLPAGSVLSSLKFSPQIGSIPEVFGLRINESTGEVAALRPPPGTSQAEIHNFLLTVSVQDNKAKKYETEIRVHVHNGVKDVWLTPSTLTIHQGADECRFTVLAGFDDGVVGDITDWAQLSYESRILSGSAPSPDVLVSPQGILRAVNPGKSARLVVTVQLPVFSIPATLTAEATVHTRSTWAAESANAKVNFVTAGLKLDKGGKSQPGGTVVPNKSDATSTKRDSVASVVENALNILFVSEGFSRESDFNDLVNKVVEDLRTQEYLQPFKLVQSSINFWSAFVPSAEDGISLLGEFLVTTASQPPTSWRGHFLGQARTPSPSATRWSLEELIHEVGFPVPSDPTTLDAIKEAWKLRYGDKPYETRAPGSFGLWRMLAEQPLSWRSVLNERDSAFGMRNSDRSRVAPTFGSVMLGSDGRRTSDANIHRFIENLTYGADPGSGKPYNLGAVWKTGGKDFGFVCFLCRTQKHAGIRWGSYFLSSTGRSGSIELRVSQTPRGAIALESQNPALPARERTLLSSVVAHELGHGLGLGDEYGDGGGAFLAFDHAEPNLLDKRIITTTTPGPTPGASRIVYDKTQEIKWLWPRITKAGMLKATPEKSGFGLRVPLRENHGLLFVVGEIVRFRQTPVLLRESLDPVARFAPNLVFTVSHRDSEGVNVVLRLPDDVILDIKHPLPPGSDPRPWADVFLALFKPGVKYALICPRRNPGPGRGTELKLVSEKIRTHVALTNGPLNAPSGNEGKGHETAVCAAPKHGSSAVMSPTNLPKGFVAPPKLPAPADIIGIYDGGGGHDCGVFRPAGRCKMRQSFDHGVPFCHVCRYILVDRIDPTKHGELDALYEPHYPK